MAKEKSGRFEMVIPSGWMDKIDGWRRAQPDLPPRAEAIRRLVDMGLRFGITVGDKLDSKIGLVTVTKLLPAIGHVEVTDKKGNGHALALSEVRPLTED